MKKIFLLILPLLYVLTSCHKDSVAPLNTITADISGVSEKFTIRVEVTKNPDNPNGYQYGMGLTGFNADTQASDDIGVYVFSQTPITTGTYKFTSWSQSSSTNTLLSYARNPSDFDYISDETQSNPGTITITSITANNIKGTFSGNVFGTNSRTLSITNGKFNINY